MQALRRGRYLARLAGSEADIAAALALRSRCFRGGTGDDRDRFDTRCRHLLVEEAGSRRPVCSFRMLPLRRGAEIDESYSAQFYDLSGLRDLDAGLIEIGRFCIRPGAVDPDILRLAWGALARCVDAEGAAMLFGCASFRGTETADHAEAFALLRDRYIAPRRWLPRVKAPDVFRFARALRRKADPARALRAMPPLLRSYLAMGGRVSDHAVIDRDLGTLHVFTGLELRALPPARARVLRAVAS